LRIFSLESLKLASASFLTSAYFNIFIGDQTVHNAAQAEYNANNTLLTKNCKIYRLPSTPEQLSNEQQQILAELDVHCSTPFT
jgi:hypothetical protein